MYKIRFNLGRGENYMKWQLKGNNPKAVAHYDPEKYCLFLMGARLTNKPKTAKKIHKGAHKVVCAWIECDHVIIYRRDEIPLEYYNVDNHSFPVVTTIGKAVFEVPQG